VYSTVLILGLSLNFGQFDKPVAYRLRSLAGKPHLSDNLEQPHLPLQPRPLRCYEACSDEMRFTMKNTGDIIRNPSAPLGSKERRRTQYDSRNTRCELRVSEIFQDFTRNLICFMV